MTLARAFFASAAVCDILAGVAFWLYTWRAALAWLTFSLIALALARVEAQHQQTLHAVRKARLLARLSEDDFEVLVRRGE